MNLSLVIIIIMLLIVLPTLARRFFYTDTNNTDNKDLSNPIFLKFPLTTAPNSNFNSNSNLMTPIHINDRKKDEKTQKNIINSHANLLALITMPSHKNAESKISQPELFENTQVYITLHAPTGQYFRGYELLQALHNAHLVYGEKKLFHQIKNNEILYSLAPLSAPYCFDLEQIGLLSTPALRLFSAAKNSQENYPDMKNTANILLEELGGKIDYSV